MRERKSSVLGLQAGELVAVRSEQEILATLDETGAIDGMPFMPEMLQYCGNRFRVYKRADKTCDTITVTGSRRLFNTVHLEGLRCNGSSHGGCQALCLLFWKEAWLDRVDEPTGVSVKPVQAASTAQLSNIPSLDKSALVELTQVRGDKSSDDVRYRCQATDLLKASRPLPWWDIRQYARDIWSGNVSLIETLKTLVFNIFLRTLKIGAYNAQIRAYNRLQSWRGQPPFPYLSGKLDKTPQETLDLQVGELIEVKSYKEILDTLNTRSRNRGLRFDAEMVPYCGSKRRVLARVERIINECTGQLTVLPNDCLILEDAICRAEYSDRRFFCPRSIYPYWREIWLRRVSDKSASLNDGSISQGQGTNQNS